MSGSGRGDKSLNVQESSGLVASSTTTGMTSNDSQGATGVSVTVCQLRFVAGDEEEAGRQVGKTEGRLGPESVRLELAVAGSA